MSFMYTLLLKLTLTVGFTVQHYRTEGLHSFTVQYLCMYSFDYEDAGFKPSELVKV